MTAYGQIYANSVSTWTNIPQKWQHMDKYTPIVTAYGQIYADSDSQNELKIWKSRILNVRRRAPHQNESFFNHKFDFQHPGCSNLWKMTIFMKSVRLDKQSDTAEYCFPSRTESKNRRSGPPRMTSENPKHLKSSSPIYIYIDIKCTVRFYPVLCEGFILSTAQILAGL